MTGTQIRKFFYDHSADERWPESDDFDCYVLFDTEFSNSPTRSITIHYEHRFVDGVSSGYVTKFEDVAEMDEAQPVTIKGLEGQGLTVYDGHRSFLVWQYPNGYILSLISEPSSDSEEVPDRTSLLTDLTQRVAPHIPTIAKGPDQELTFYPEDSAPYDVEHSPPLTPWPTPEN